MTIAPDTGTYHPVDTGAYEVLRDRLIAQAAELARRAEALNVRRGEEFGSTRLELVGTGRLRTEHSAVPRDVVAVGAALLFGSNAVPSREAGTRVDDVLALYDRDLKRLPDDAVPGLLDDPAFVREFAALHRYYRQARLLRLRRTEGKLLAVFQTGEKADDTRVLRWALSDDGRATFLDARGERDHVLPPSHDVEWIDSTREDHALGRHPHVSIRGEVFVSTVGGALTVKVDDETEVEEGVYSEPVDEPLQSLADADIAYARVGALILLRIRPYKEDTDRHLVFNTLTRTVVRLDGIGRACRRLPEDQGIVFPGGYCLAAGTHKSYELETAELEFEREDRSPNGEDVLYAFHARAEGRSLLLSYNTIRKEMANPLPCQGWALFDDGALVVLRADTGESQRVHPVQWWTSPYVSDTHAAAQPVGTGPLARIGNADLVRGISDCLSITGAVADTTPTNEVYEALLTACVRAADTHHWLAGPELGDLHAPLAQLRDTAQQVLAEFATVQALTRQAEDALTEAAARVTEVVRRLRGESARSAAEWVTGLTELRHAQGHLLTLKDMRYADTARIEALAADTASDLAALGRRAVAHLAREDAFAGHDADVEQLVADAEAITTVAEAEPVAARMDDLAVGLRTVTEVVAGLDIADATVRTAILERIAASSAASTAPAPASTAGAANSSAERGEPSSPPSAPCSASPSPARSPPRTAPRRATNNSPSCSYRWRTWSPGSPSSTTSSPPSPTSARRFTRRSPPASRPSPTPAPAAPNAWRTPRTVCCGPWPAGPPPSRTPTPSPRISPPTRCPPRSAASPTNCATWATRSGRRSWTAASRPPARTRSAPCATAPTSMPTTAARSASAPTGSPSTPSPSTSPSSRTATASPSP